MENNDDQNKIPLAEEPIFSTPGEEPSSTNGEGVLFSETEGMNPEAALEQILSEEIANSTEATGEMTSQEPATSFDTTQFSILIYPRTQNEHNEILWSILSPHDFGFDKTELELLAKKNQSIRLSRLNEFSFIFIAQKLHQEAIPFLVQKSEEIISAEPEIQSEGAPPVILPSNYKEVLLVTSKDLPGFNIIETKQIISAHSSLARKFLKKEDQDNLLNREIQKLKIQKNTKIPTSNTEKIFKNLFLDLQLAALQQGANAVLDIRIESFNETNGLIPENDQVRIIAYGTAALLEKI